MPRYIYNKYGAATNQGRGDYAETGFGSDGQPIGARAESVWLWVVPWGMRSILNWVNDR